MVSAAATMFPLFWVFLTSFKPPEISQALPPVWNFTPTLQNYRDAMTGNTYTSQVFGVLIVHSFIVTLASTLVGLAAAVPAAYALARIRFAGIGNNKMFRVAAVGGEADTAPVLAKEEIAHPAGRANAAVDGKIDRDAIAGLEPPHAYASGDDHSSGFVPGDAFAGGVAPDHRVAVVEAQITAANARRFDLNEDFARPWGWNFDGANLDPLIARQEHRFHSDTPE